MKRRKLRPAYEYLINDRIVNELQGEFGKLRDICLRDDIRLTFSDTVKFILQLQNALEILVRPILVENCRVFITITGISKLPLYAAIEQSAVSLQTIILPVLTDNHMCSILADLFGVNLNLLPSLVANVTQWLGGVPRFLEYYLCLVAKKARAKSLKEVWEWLCTENNNQFMDVLLSTRSQIADNGLGEGALPDDVLDNIFSIAISGFSIKLNQCLVLDDALWTVEYAQNRSLLYCKGTPTGVGKVIMPPLLLHHINSIPHRMPEHRFNH